MTEERRLSRTLFLLDTTSPPAQRRLAVAALVCALLVILALAQFVASPHVSGLAAQFYPSSELASLGTSTASELAVLNRLYHQERLDVLSDWDQEASEGIIRAPVGAFDPSLERYMERLSGFIGAYFGGSNHQDPLRRSLSHVQNDQLAIQQASFEKRVITWDKAGKDGLPREFRYWYKRLVSRGWRIDAGDDEDVEIWFEQSTGIEPGLVDETGGAHRWRALWNSFRRPVLKSDTLRYLVMLTSGGLYTDSDTSILSDPFFWGTHARPFLPPAISALRRSIRYLSSGESEPQPSLGIRNPEINLVISVEYDETHPRQDERVGYTRSLQFIQWAFMSKPYHPVMLDVLEGITRRFHGGHNEGDELQGWGDIVDATGPAAFTDAVLRYLLVRYGVTPESLLSMEDGLIVGDVLILPLHAFGQWLGGEKNWNGGDPTTRCIAHGFQGRWKNDHKRRRRHIT